MKHVLRTLARGAIAVLLGAAFAVSAQEGLTAEESKWVEAAQRLAKYGDAAGVRTTIAVVSDPEPGQSPAFLAYYPDGQRCTLGIAVRGNPLLVRYLAIARTESERELLRTMAMAHELGHCLLRFEEATAKPALKPLAERDEEGLCDLYALFWFEQEQASALSTVRRLLLRMRRHVKEGSLYDTTQFIEAAAGQTAPTATGDPWQKAKATLAQARP